MKHTVIRINHKQGRTGQDSTGKSTLDFCLCRHPPDADDRLATLKELLKHLDREDTRAALRRLERAGGAVNALS